MTKIEGMHRPGTKGETWNPVTGCTKISPGCAHCYAERMSKRLAGRFGYPADVPFRVTLHPERLDEPLKWRIPRTCFICSMGDLFHEDVHWSTTATIFDLMARSPIHAFLGLTKRPALMQAFLAWYTPSKGVTSYQWPFDNVWLGVTAENQEMADKRIPILGGIPAAIRFVSVEPMIGPVDMHNVGPEKTAISAIGYGPQYGRSAVDWVIVGGETGPGRRKMQLDWARDVRDQCHSAGIPFFFKRTGNGPTPDDLKIREWPEG